MKSMILLAKSMMILMVSMILIATSMISEPSFAITEEQEELISSHCDLIKDSIKTVQRDDSRTRVYLGGYYEAVLSKFVIPFNVKLVEESLSDADFVENQNNLTEMRNTFSNDFINYQKSLEELSMIDCKAQPNEFYDKLTSVRKKRKVVNQDVAKMRSLISEHIKLVKELKEAER